MNNTLFYIIRYFKRVFTVIDYREVIYLNLTFQTNVYGDDINRYNCRSFFTDENGKIYKVNKLYKEN